MISNLICDAMLVTLVGVCGVGLVGTAVERVKEIVTRKKKSN